MGAGSICVQFPLFGSCRYHKYGSVLIGIRLAGFKSRSNPGVGAPAWTLLFQAGSSCVPDFLATSPQRDKPCTTVMKPLYATKFCGSAFDNQACFDNSSVFLYN